jgi:hypothetical protein
MRGVFSVVRRFVLVSVIVCIFSTGSGLAAVKESRHAPGLFDTVVSWVLKRLPRLQVSNSEVIALPPG